MDTKRHANSSNEKQPSAQRGASHTGTTRAGENGSPLPSDFEVEKTPTPSRSEDAEPRHQPKLPSYGDDAPRYLEIDADADPSSMGSE